MVKRGIDRFKVPPAIIGGLFLLAGLTSEVAADKVAEVVDPGTHASTTVPDIFLPAPRELMQQIVQAKRALSQQHYSVAVLLLGQLLDNPDSEDYFMTDRRQPGRMVSLKAEAHRILSSMSKAGRAAYELQFGADARRLLEHAVNDGNIDKLVDVSRKYFHTEAGHQATLILGRYRLDRSQPLAAALILQRLANTSGVAAQFEPELSLSLALAWLYVGVEETARDVLLRLKGKTSYLAIDSVGMPENLFEDVDRALAWLSDQIESHRGALGTDEDDWLVFRGNASRTARNQGDMPLIVSENPLVNCRWRVATSNNSGMENEITKVQRQYLTAGIPALPSVYPLAVQNVILMRTPSYLFAVDAETGKRTWLYDDFSSQLGVQSHTRSGRRNAQTVRKDVLGGWHQRIWDDVPYGHMSSDGKRVYLIDKLGYPTNLRRLILRNGININNPLGPKPYNELVALELATEGKRKWAIGGKSGEDEAQLAGAFFLGAPLPIAAKLYGLAETNGEIRLVVLDAKNGQLIWQQPLVHTDESSGTIRVNSLRRLAGATPSFADGVLVCPTSSGAIVAVDVATRSLMWGFQYDVLPRGGRIRHLNLTSSTRTGIPLGTRWTDATVTLSQGNVILTPVESNYIYCVRLLDGNLRWKRQRDDNLFVACVHDGGVILVGKHTVTALDLDNGRDMWSASVTSSSGAMPSGRGYYDDKYYYFPTTARELIKVDLERGDVVDRMSTGSILGNLICFDDCVISQNVDYLTSFYQVDPLRRDVMNRLSTKSDDAMALAHHAQLLLKENKRQEALMALRRSYRLQENDATRALLVDTLLRSLQEDFAANELLASEVEQLIDQPVQLTEYLRLMTLGLRQVGKLPEAFAVCMKLIDAGRDRSASETVGAHLLLRRDRWIRQQLDDIRSVSDPKDRVELDALVGQYFARASQSESSESLRGFIDHFGFHSAAERARLMLAERLLESGQRLEAELLLTQLAGSTEPAFAARADALLAKLYEHVGLYRKAAELYQRLGRYWTDVVCVDDQTGKELWEQAQKKSGLTIALKEYDPWPHGRVEITSRKTALRPYAAGFRQIHPLTEFRNHGRGLNDVQISLDWQQMLVGKDRHGRERFRVSLINTDGRLQRTAKSLITQGKAYGHLLVTSHVLNVIAVNTLPGNAASDDHILWRHSLATDARGSAPIRHIQQKMKTNVWGAHRWITTARNQKEEVLVGRLGPLTHNGICFQKGQTIVCIDPLHVEDQPIWVREGIALGCDLFGDDRYLFVVEPGETEALVIRQADGMEVGPRRVPPEDYRWTTMGRNILTWNQTNNQLVLALYDPWYEEEVWSHPFAAGSKGYLIENDEVAVLQPNGLLVLLSLEDGTLRVNEQLEPEDNLDAIYVIRSSEQYLLVTSTPVRSGDHGVNIFSAPNGATVPMINGRVYAIDRRSGRLQWPVPAVVQQYGLPLSQPSASPVLLFMRHHRAPKEKPRVVTTSVLCLSKRDGRILLASDNIPGATGTYSVEVQPATHELVLSLMGTSFHMKFTNAPTPPEPPAQTGAIPSLQGKRKPIVDRLFKAAQRGVEEIDRSKARRADDHDDD